MLLYLVRHGKAEPGDDDAARRLTDGGRKAVARIARNLSDAGIQVDRIEHSGLARAAETAEILAKATGGEVVAVVGLGPSDDVTAAAHRLEGIDNDSIMLVGHLPFVGRLAGYLLTGKTDAEPLHFRAGAIACLSSADRGWVLEWLLPPDLA
jgi:phosphohistidine phosphatase